MTVEPTRDEVYDEWLNSRPPRVAACARNFPPGTCYRSMENPGHYVLWSYVEEKDGSVTVTIDHLEDSYGYGLRVYGIPPETLNWCGCIDESTDG